MALGIIGGLLGGLFKSRAASKAAKSQERMAAQDIAFQKETRDLIRGDLSGYRDFGTNALAGYGYELGLSERPQGYAGFQKTPGYDFAMQQGNDSINALAGARGGLDSGATRQALAGFNQGLANQEYGNWLSRLGAGIDTGLSAAQMSGQASTNAAAGVSNALGSIGNARAAGAIAQGNAWSGALENAIGAWKYQQKPPSGMNGLFGGGR